MTDQYIGGNAEYESQTENDAWCSTSQGHLLGSYPEFSFISDKEAYWRVGYDRINYPAGSATKHLAEFGLKNDHRIRVDETGIYGWDGSQWVDLLVPGGVSDHGELTGLEDDDHSQYHNVTRANTWLGTKSLANLGTRNHTDLQNVLTDQHHTKTVNTNRSQGTAHANCYYGDYSHAAYGHISSSGSSHSYINQSLTTTANVRHNTISIGSTSTQLYMSGSDFRVSNSLGNIYILTSATDKYLYIKSVSLNWAGAHGDFFTEHSARIPEDLQLNKIMKIKNKEDGTIDKSTFPEEVKKISEDGDIGLDLGAQIKMLIKGMQELIEKNESLRIKLEKLENP